MPANFIITIGRQLGSGGRILGEELARNLNIAFYDKRLIEQASTESGLAPEFFEQADEKVNPAFAGGMFSDIFSNNYFSNETFFKIQSDVIREIAARESAVIVGRCADYVLRDFEPKINIFVTADRCDRVTRVMDYHHLTAEKATALVEKTDKRRASFYNYYSNKTWGEAASYDLCINTSVLGMERTIQFVAGFVRMKLGLE